MIWPQDKQLTWKDLFLSEKWMLQNFKNKEVFFFCFFLKMLLRILHITENKETVFHLQTVLMMLCQYETSFYFNFILFYNKVSHSEM